ncbi:MAG: acetyl-CoA carboxylase biotin carboxyl carrier protein [Chloroflexota bacterium]|nr:acetyl-CoA carboxylase biotin carboxyl carrier protein [Chloroflexota bacterium]
MRELIELVSSSGVTELSIERGDTKLMIRSAPAEQVQAAVAAAQTVAEAVLAQTEPGAAGVPITSPIVGTFYSAPTPGAEPFVQVGDYVEEGQTVGIVEAMKVMNRIDSEISGRVLEVLVQNGQAVEYGQPLMLLDTSASAT